jgi:hypothetical protein
MCDERREDEASDGAAVEFTQEELAALCEETMASGSTAGAFLGRMWSKDGSDESRSRLRRPLLLLLLLLCCCDRE